MATTTVWCTLPEIFKISVMLKTCQVKHHFCRVTERKTLGCFYFTYRRSLKRKFTPKLKFIRRPLTNMLMGGWVTSLQNTFGISAANTSEIGDKVNMALAGKIQWIFSVKKMILFWVKFECLGLQQTLGWHHSVIMETFLSWHNGPYWLWLYWTWLHG